ncbi:hypothetical protein SAMN06296056_103137 [Priestia filamentosa]|nr:hypothetical protein SAMN06296056_103137 [Priestia filamentosa]
MFYVTGLTQIAVLFTECEECYNLSLARFCLSVKYINVIVCIRFSYDPFEMPQQYA